MSGIPAKLGRWGTGTFVVCLCLGACGGDEGTGDGGHGAPASGGISSGGSAGASGSGGSGLGGAASGGGSAELGYCDVAPILDTKCRVCHTDPPERGAPFSLEGYEALFTEMGAARLPLYERMHDVVESEYMPPTWMTGVEELTEAERARLLAWLEADAPWGVGACE